MGRRDAEPGTPKPGGLIPKEEESVMFALSALEEAQSHIEAAIEARNKALTPTLHPRYKSALKATKKARKRLGAPQ